MLPLDRIVDSSRSFSPNINRNLMRTILVNEPNPRRWQGTKINAGPGYVGPRKYVVPSGLGDYLDEAARRAHAAYARMSDQQHSKIEVAFQRNLGRFSGSDAFAAMQADVVMFGSQAFV